MSKLPSILLIISLMLFLMPIEAAWAGGSTGGYFRYDPRTSMWIWIPAPWSPTYGKEMVTITIKGLPSEYSTTIRVDGVEVGSIEGGSSRSFEVDRQSSHTFQVDEKIQGESSSYDGTTVFTRYVCPANSWTANLLRREESHVVPVCRLVRVCRGCLCGWQYVCTYVTQTRTISELGEKSHTFEYHCEHEVFVEDPYGTNSDEWFREGSDISLSAREIIPTRAGNERVAFQHWRVNGVEKEVSSVSLKINKPHVVKAIYKKEYRIRVSSEFGNPVLDRSGGWYPEGEEATVSIEGELPMEGLLGFLGVKRVFHGWYSDKGLESKRATFSFTVDGPKNLRAEWKRFWLWFSF